MAGTLIIAEAGVNHNGDMALAYRLVDAAAAAKADIVKFQTAVPELVVTSGAAKAEYQSAGAGEAESQLAMLKKIHLPLDAYRPLQQYCAARGIQFMSTAFDLPSLDLLLGFDMPYLKIPSGEITNYPYLQRAAAPDRKLIISTGMSDLATIRACLDLVTSFGARKENITLLHCTTEYPAPFEDVNLHAMQTLAQTFGVGVGYSDHTPGIEISLAAAALGAVVIEKHFTLDRSMEGPDHSASLEPTELAALVKAVRHIEEALGDGVKRIAPSERKNVSAARKSLVAARDIAAGEPFTAENLCVKRPGTGMSPMEWPHVLGRPSPRAFHKDELIEL